MMIRGEKLSKPIYYEGSQWAVTKYGIEARDGSYVIEKNRLWQDEPNYSWEKHMEEKNWVNIHDFTRAMNFAKEKFKNLKPFKL